MATRDISIGDRVNLCTFAQSGLLRVDCDFNVSVANQAGNDNSGYCQLNDNFADPTTAGWVSVPTQCYQS
jgi:hypothetical protein